MKRKIFAAFLSLMMVISMLPTSAFATEVDVPADCQHANAHWETVKEATCTVAGKQVLHCHDCEKDLEEKEIPALGHDLQPTGEFVDPTCTKVLVRCMLAPAATMPRPRSSRATQPSLLWVTT